MELHVLNCSYKRSLNVKKPGWGQPKNVQYVGKKSRPAVSYDTKTVLQSWCERNWP